MKQQIVVIGLGRFGSALAEELTEAGHEVLGIDENMAEVQRMASKLTHVVQADAADEAVLESLGIAQFDAGIVAISTDIEASILITLALKRSGVRRVVAKAQNERHGEILTRVGADQVVFPERDTGQRLAHSWTSVDIQDTLEIFEGYIVSRVTVPAEFIERTVGELLDGRPASITLFLVARGNRAIVYPAASEVLRKGDVLVLAGAIAEMEQFFSEVHGRS